MALAKIFNQNKTVQDDCYSLGLIHNAGMALISAQAPAYPQLMQAGLQAGHGQSEIEEQHFHTCNEVLGFLIAESWSLPPALCNVIAYHHSPQLMLGSDSHRELTLFALLKLAEYFSGECRMLFQVNLDPEWQQYVGALLELLELDSLQLPELAEQLHQLQLHTVYSVG